MDVIYTCECGVRTREPFKVNGTLMCALCAERVAPRLVDMRAARSWRQFVDATRIPKSRTGRPWYGKD